MWPLKTKTIAISEHSAKSVDYLSSLVNVKHFFAVSEKHLVTGFIKSQNQTVFAAEQWLIWTDKSAILSNRVNLVSMINQSPIAFIIFHKA